MAAKRNLKGKTWKQHAGPYLSKALKTAAATWRPKNQRANKTKLGQLRRQRDVINNKIRVEVEKG